MLQITFSNRLEYLASALVERLSVAPASPFTAEEIIIPSAAIRRKVDMAITDHFGICANVRFSFLARWLWQEIGKFIPVDNPATFAAATLGWRIFALFDDADFIAAHPRLAAYLVKADPVMRFDLATRTATLFDQYLTYRPDWIEHWSNGILAAIPDATGDQSEDQAWQAALWQRILQDLGTSQQHLSPAMLKDLQHAIHARDNARPERVFHVFCVPTIPPVHLEALRELGRQAHIHLYLLNPCQQYWFDVVDQKRLSYLALRGDQQHHEVGHRLLAAWGKQTQAQLEMLFDVDAAALVDDAGFTAHDGTHLLGQLQNSILHLCEFTPASITLADTDRSIEFHCCHSLTRELEVLQDQLLALFAGPNPPLPSDVLVVTPRLDEAAALIDTVFGSVPFSRRIPYSITGRAASQTNEAARALLGLLSLASSRITASSVFGLLQQGIVGRRFGFDNAMLDVLHGWIEQAGIRWGLDAAHRAALGLPETAHCTFEEGLQRLFLGYALPATVDLPFAERLPAANIEGGDAAILGRFWHCMQAIRQWQRELALSRNATQWLPFLANMTDALLAPDNEQVEQVAQVHHSLRELHEQLRHAHVDIAIPESVMRAALTALLDESAKGGVPTGSVTFAGLTSLRNLPYRVICAIGLNDGVFPATMRALEFDLMAGSPQRGDRQRGSDERNLFLDLILSARDRLYLSFTGRGIRDNAPMPPSVLLADLLDSLVPAIATDANDSRALAAARQRLLLEHPLQPFSLTYFTPAGDARLTSANEEYCAALQHALSVPQEGIIVATDDADDDEVLVKTAKTFFSVHLPAPDVQWRSVSADQLKRFFNNPCRYLLQQRLNVRLQDDDATLPDEEPFLPQWQGQKALATRLLPLFARQLEIADITALARAGTELPAGPMGELALEDLLRSLQKFSAALAGATNEPCLPPHQAIVPFTLDGEAWQLCGSFSDLRASGLVRSRYDDTRAADYLAGWIDHLILNAALPAGVTGATCWISRDGQYRLAAVADARDSLEGLMRLYRLGLSRPLHFFPKSALQFMANEQDLKFAHRTWTSSKFSPFGEDRDLAYQLALRGVADPLDTEFEDAAVTVFAPLLRSLTDPRLAP